MTITPMITFLNETNDDVFNVVLQTRCVDLAMDILSHVSWNQACELTITVCDNQAIQALNKDHRGKDKPTNVLSFPAYDPDDPVIPDSHVHLGDIIMAWQVIKSEAKLQNKSRVDHFYHLFVHGLLHLLGYDHETDEEARIMETIEIDILAKHDVKNPYA